MNKYALLCAVVIAAPVLAECDRACGEKAGTERTEDARRGEKLAADVVKSTLRSGEEESEATRSSCCKCGKCSSCSTCKSCSTCCGCKSVEMDEEATKCACDGKAGTERTVEAGSEDEVTRKCSSCGCSCGKCGCK